MTSASWLEAFLDESGDRLRRGLVARFGVQIGCEAHADAVAWASEHADELRAMSSPLGYLFRVGQSSARRYLRWQRHPVELPPVDSGRDPDVEPGLPGAIAGLGVEERTAVVLVHCHGWTYVEVAELLEVEVTTVNNYVSRGMTKLRRSLGVTS
ncbi:MAG: sigma-70 family RNA polymerase sigma factor [Ilumatobacter sp.]|uniref:RNA polymerase sigma factor n=1 Tax=Ilumatobacter sp. TaxID=1967498 RepID=UPI002625D2F4|nr:sigma-70 family RNA polymerase sigma factor [Ilumatobacter sp.]MDJ0768164.1 sigma-70 family RNA polymerase sigma factor [Ilumatobacter sp.]